MKILHLTLKWQYFYEIYEGFKKVEFRLIKPYWTKRLEGKTFDEIWFKNGYGKNSPFMRIECLRIGKGQNYYVIKLGKILEVRNWKYLNDTYQR